MQNPIQISFQHLEPSPALETAIRRRAEQLEKFFPRMTSLRVVITRSSPRHRQGNLFQVRIDVTLPGSEIVASGEGARDPTHADPYVAIRDAFHIARRQIQYYVRVHFRQRRRVPAPEPQAESA